VEPLHRASGADHWLAVEPPRDGRPRRRLPVRIHRTSEPGHWIVAYPWREAGRAEQIGQAAFRLAERGADPARVRGRGAAARRSLSRSLPAIEAADRRAPLWIRDEERRVPVASLTGTNGKSTTTRMLTHILKVAGRRVGTTTSDGVYIDEELLEEGDLTGPAGSRSVLARSDVGVAVLETARGGIVLKGLGYESNDVSVVTNVTSDHLDLHGLHTLPELAEVKAVITRVTRPDGTVVLNAEDLLVLGLARKLRASVCLFSLDPSNRAIRRHVAAGQRAMVLDDGRLVELNGGRRAPIMPVADAPATLFGFARHNVANALAAAGAARALGASRDEVAAGLRDFRPSAELAPGRLNIYRAAGRLVVVDFAHNEAGVAALLDVAEGLAGGSRDSGTRVRSLTTIVGTAGDRPDDALRGVGRIAAERSDRLVVKETIRYLRGRTRESVVGELLAGMREGGAGRGQIPVYESEATALRAELERPIADGRGVADALAAADAIREVLVIMSQAERDEVFEVLRAHDAQPIDLADDLAAVMP